MTKEKRNRHELSREEIGAELNPDDLDLREDNDLTQKEVAKILNCAQQTYSKYELGKINIPIDVFIKLADYYDVTIDYLVGRSKEKK